MGLGGNGSLLCVCVYPISDACGCLVPGSLRGSSLDSSVFSSPVIEGSVVYSRAR